MRCPATYELKVKGSFIITIFLFFEYVTKYATREAVEADDEDDEEEELSSIDSFSDEEAPGMEL